MSDLPTLTDEERQALQRGLRSLAEWIDDSLDEATGHHLPFVLLTWDANGTFHISNANKDCVRQVMQLQLDRWNEEPDALPNQAKH